MTTWNFYSRTQQLQGFQAHCPCPRIRFSLVRLCVCLCVFVFLHLYSLQVHNFIFFFVFAFSLSTAKPQNSLRQPNHRGRGGGRGGGPGRGAGHGDFRQARDLRDGPSEGKTGGHPNKMSSQNTSNRKGNQPPDK